MTSILPVANALVPRDSDAAQRLHAPNYDEFQSDLEIYELIRRRPDCVLRITMAQCDVASPERIQPEGSEPALQRAVANLRSLIESDLTGRVRDVLWVNDIEDPSRPGVRQIGLGGLARTGEIRSDANPDGTLIRNEGIREEKARGRAVLIERTRALTDSVNMAVEDEHGRLAAVLAAYADARPCDFAATDEKGNRHRVWLVSEPAAIANMSAVLAAEPHAFVADGNHRSAAAAMAGLDGFLAVFFPAATMGIKPYNRLVRSAAAPPADLERALAQSFTTERLQGATVYQPARTHEIGLYTDGRWLKLVPRAGAYDPEDAAQSIDSDIVQRVLFTDVFGIDDPGDPRLTFVGGDRDASYLRKQVDAGHYEYAVTLPAVTMQQFIAVCRRGRFMPPKSTWFEPKLRSGLVIALLD